MSDPVVVVGAGVGGLACALRLAAAGERVVVVERNAEVGGKMGELRADGYRWDTGPSVVTMRHVLEELFACAGERLEEHLELAPVDPLARYFFADGSRLDASLDPARMEREVARVAPQDVAGYRAFMEYARRLHRITGPVFVYDRPPRWTSFLRVPPWDALRVDALRTLDARVRRHVRSPQMRQLLDRFATYAGSDPFRASATLGVIADVELSGGVWYPRGGVRAIAAALERLARARGVELATGVGAAAIELDDGRPPRARGVRLEDGRTLRAKAVVANVDVRTVYRRLLPSGAAPARLVARLERQEPSCSGFALLLGVRGEHPELAHHNVLFCRDYAAEFRDVFARRRLPEDPTVYVAITSRTDPGHAPPGCENWFVLVNAPARPDAALGGPEDADELARCRARILERIAEAGVDLDGRIETERRLTPRDLERGTGAWRGALYGAALNGALSPFRRPHNRARGVRGLYFVGGTTHPGGGVPMVALSARVVASLLAEDGLVAAAAARPGPLAAPSEPPTPARTPAPAPAPRPTTAP